MNKLSIILFSFLFVACVEHKSTKENDKLISESKLLYAENFKIQKFKNYTKLIVTNPWQSAQNIEYEYFLSSDSNLVSNNNYIQVPIKKVAVLSTTHIGLLDFIDETSSVIAVSGLDFVCNEEINKNKTLGKVQDIGYGANLNYELLLKLHPDVIFVYGVTAETQSQINKLKDLGLKPVIIAEYLEKIPLAQAEWCKFMSEFFNKSTQIEKKYQQISNEYNKYKKLALSTTTRPLVMANLPYKGVWYVAGGNSFPSKLIQDAGAKYIWEKENSREAIPMNIEKVITTTKTADIWINSGFANSLSDILSVDERISKISSFAKGEVYNNNKIKSKLGGNDYFESGIANPQLLLKDLISIFHPEIFPNYHRIYYQKLKEGRVHSF